MNRNIIKWSLALLALVLCSTAAHATTNACPSVGADTLCGLTITVNPDGSFTTTASGQGPYDSVEDTLFGVVNNSSTPLLTLNLSSSTLPLFGFDGDGACTFITCTGGDATGYGGFVSANLTPVTSGTPVTFSGINTSTFMSGTVNFGPNGIAPGGTAWFSLEEAVTVNTIVVGTVPEPGTLVLFGSGLLGLAGVIRRKLGV